jgi:hypothetical protein
MEVYWLNMLHPPPKLALSEKYANSGKTYGRGDKYGSLPRNRAYLLMQLRTGHSWLASHAKLHRFREDDKFECGARETVVHVLIDCPRLSTLRQKLREEVGEAFNNITLMLGGRDKRGPKKLDSSA